MVPVAVVAGGPKAAAVGLRRIFARELAVGANSLDVEVLLGLKMEAL
jgi:hypothetical protein